MPIAYLFYLCVGAFVGKKKKGHYDHDLVHWVTNLFWDRFNIRCGYQTAQEYAVLETVQVGFALSEIDTFLVKI